MNEHIMVFNPSKEQLDVLVEGNGKSNITVVMVHGLGTDKHETMGLFDDIAAGLPDKYRVVRFDFSGFGKSEGRTEDFDYYKHADDLKAVLEFVKKTYGGTIYIIAQSMGTFVTSLLNPKGITKTVFTGIPNSNSEYIIERLMKRFETRPGCSINQNGVSLILRSSGVTQKWGSQFWKTLRKFNPIESVSSYSQNTQLLIIHPKQDDVVGLEFQKEYASIPNIFIEWIDGDHSFKKRDDRSILVDRIKLFFLK